MSIESDPEDEDNARNASARPWNRESSVSTSRGSKNAWAILSICALVLTAIVAMFLLALSMGMTGALGPQEHHEDQDHHAEMESPHQPVSTTAVDEPTPTQIYPQTALEEYAGPIVTASIPPFLAATGPAAFGSPSAYVPNEPIQTAVPVADAPDQFNIFRMTGQLSPYAPASDFGVGEYSLPPGANITAIHVLHRHGSRYPTEESSVSDFGDRIHEMTKNGVAAWSGSLEFLNHWRYNLGAEILTHLGQKELFDSGVLHYYNYGALYNPSTKIVARTTTQNRMLRSAQYFMSGFFGLDYTQNVTIEAQIEAPGFNTSLTGYLQCPNSDIFHSSGGTTASVTWREIYLQNATARLGALSGNYNWTVSDSYNAQTLCPYETVAFGSSPWCSLFTYEEWKGFEYSIDLSFNGNDGFASPTARGIGIGYVQEFYARLQGHLYDLPMGATNVNYTLDTMETTFPTNQSLYFDFSHDTNIMAVIAAFGLRQFAEDLSPSEILTNRSLIVSHLTPFAGRMVWEVIQTPQPVKSQRPSGPDATSDSNYDDGDVTTYIHLLINQRTVPLHRSYPECETRDDGWCEMGTFMQILSHTLDIARYEYSCFGDYSGVPYGEIKDGVPITKRDIDMVVAMSGPGSHL